MEIERKFTIKELPKNIDHYGFHLIQQGYLCTNPVVRVRRQDEEYYLTYKGSGMMSREEYNLPLTRESYEHLLEKVDGNIISKKRYLIPVKEYLPDSTLTIELDVFDAPFEELIIAEVEFSSEEEANEFLPPDWFQEDVTYNSAYHNSNLSRKML
ncbi:MAG: CYTH domain-containing protein [Lachnospiraceae bacterium]|nr:CYTH domain-containing protein [Lachnospiraceae bacterium]